MDDWQDRRWLRRHAMVAPYGVFAATLLLTLYLKQWQWHGRDSWELATSQVDLAAVLYAMVAVLVERGFRLMFWALDERRKWRAQWRAAAMAEGHAEGLALGRTEGHAEGLALGRTEGHAEGHAEGQVAGRAEGLVAGRAEGQVAGRAEGLAEGQVAGRAEGLAEGRAEGQVAGRAEGHAAGRAETRQQYDAWLAKVAQKRGIPLDDLLPPNRDAE